MMRRREFITLLGGATAWPLAARAQQPRPSVIGYLGATTAAAERPRTDAFVHEYRWAEGRTEGLSEIAAGLVRLRVDVILATSTAAALACKQATAVIPIVFPISVDPLAAGLVASLARPGGNVTGLSNEAFDSAGKRLGILQEVVPGLRRGSPPVRAAKPASATIPIVFNLKTAKALGLDVPPLRATAAIAHAHGRLAPSRLLPKARALAGPPFCFGRSPRHLVDLAGSSGAPWRGALFCKAS